MPEGYPAFVPAPLPPRLTFTRELAVALSRADAALGALSGLGDELPNPVAMAAPFLRQEALCSSRIEGADVSLTEILLDEIAAAPAGTPLDQLAGVRNVLATLAYGVECVATSPLDLALLRSLHQRLLHGEAVTARGPGEFRTTQNWIGPPGATLATAAYVPPPVPQMNVALERLEGFLAERDQLPDLVQCAMAHAQFESIHPFVDSNGRMGRILIVLFLVVARQALAAAPVPLRLSRGAPPRVLHPAAACAHPRRLAAVAASSSPRVSAKRRSAPGSRRACCCASVSATAPRPRARRPCWSTSSSCRPSSPCATCGGRCR